MQSVLDMPEVKLQTGLMYKDRSGRVVQITQQKQNCCCTFYEGAVQIAGLPCCLIYDVHGRKLGPLLSPTWEAEFDIVEVQNESL